MSHQSSDTLQEGNTHNLDPRRGAGGGYVRCKDFFAAHMRLSTLLDCLT